MNEDVGDERSEGEGGATYQRVRGELLNRLLDGTYALDSRLPSQRELSEQFDVSRDTVQKVLRELAGEGWISSRQGSGTRVIKVLKSQAPISSAGGRRVTLGELMDDAFKQPEVTLDVFTLSSESLAFQIRRQDEQIRLGERPELQRIALRMLLPVADLQHPPYPTAVDDVDKPAVWERHLVTMRSSTTSIKQKLHDLRVAKLVPSVSLEIRYVRFPPLLKLYLVNGSAMLSAPYVSVKRPIYLEGHDDPVDAIDVLGVGAPLTYDVKDHDPQSQASEKVDNWRMWFESAWDFLTE
ncbi:GntR family transcriptional regulator [Streptomyces sp. SLBN-8D4]|uniref:GntR family transcriptional regulator n=1 Tax=Streptomyces sp. SLBN-8D4 TaxID=3377728 RepID=UPI003C7EA7DA